MYICDDPCPTHPRQNAVGLANGIAGRANGRRVRPINLMKMALTSTIISSLLFFFIGQIVNAGEADRKKWNKRYDAMEYIYGKEPIKFLKENVDLLTKGKALVLAMGEGRNAVFLARNGFDVDCCDISEKAVEKCESLAWESGVTLNAFQADLDEYKIPADKYDLITCFYYTQRDLIPQIKEGLREGGMVMFETYTIDQLKYGKDAPGPKNPDYLLEHKELRNFFKDFNILYYREGEIAENKSVASLIAQKK